MSIEQGLTKGYAPTGVIKVCGVPLGGSAAHVG
jgi:hypothetical protein